MEFTEVVSPTVAVPVVGVLICAFLVFAFGFKSPVQPPSFNFEDDTKKKKLKKQKHSKGQSNGHVVTGGGDSDDAGSNTKSQASPKQVKTSGKQSPGASKTSNKKTEQTKTDKKTKKNVAAKGVQPQQPAHVEDEDGWTTQISRKEKKQRNKKEDKPTESDKNEMMTEEKMEVPPTKDKVEVITKVETEAAPMDQRSKKKSKKKSQKEAEEIAPPAKAVPDVPAPAEIKPVEKPVVVPTAEKPKETVVDESTTKKSKSKKKSASPPPQSEVVKEKVQKETTVTAPSSAPKEKSTDEVFTTVKSPKKKKKPAVDVIEPQVEDKPAPIVAKEEKVTKQTPPSPELSTKPTGAKESSSDNKENVSTDAASNSSQPPVSFDEMGVESWIEAKPKSKKKKARREN